MIPTPPAGLRILGIDHVAICTASLDEAARPFVDALGLRPGPREVVEAQKTEAFFLLPSGTGEGDDDHAACVELIAPAGSNPGLEKFLGKRGPGLHHVAFRVDDVAASLRTLAARGVPLIDQVPRPGARGHVVGFLHPSACGGVLVELVGHPPATPGALHAPAAHQGETAP